MLGWLRRLAGLGDREAPSATPVRPAPAPVRASTPEAVRTDDPLAAFMRALGVPVPAEPPPLDEEAELAELELSRTVLEHTRANKLGPASSPAMSLRILNLVASPRAEVSELARVISADPALSAGVLNVANSAVYRGVDETETVRDAVARLGLDEVGRVAGALSARSLFNPKLRLELQVFGPRFAELYRRAVTVATGAAALAMRRPGARSDRVYLGGMLHDVGRAVALRAVAELSRAGPGVLDPGDPRIDRVVDRVHVEVGAEVHQAWQLPQYLTVLAVRHHDPEIPADPEFVDLHVVRLTAAVHDLRAGGPVAWRAAREVVQSAGALGLDARAVRAAATELRQVEERIVAAFGLDATPPGRGS